MDLERLLNSDHPAARDLATLNEQLGAGMASALRYLTKLDPEAYMRTVNGGRIAVYYRSDRGDYAPGERTRLVLDLDGRHLSMKRVSA